MFDTWGFWGALAATAALLHLIDPSRVRIRAAVLAVAGLLVLWKVLALDLVAMAIVVGTVIWVPQACRVAARFRERGANLATFAAMSPVLVAWVLGKLSGAFAVAAGLAPLAFVGFSFLLVRAWTAAKDAIDGRVERLDPALFAAHLLFFPAYVAGPMHLYGELEATLRAPEPVDGEALVDAGFRVLVGFAKIRIVVPLLRPVSLEALVPADVITPGALLVGALAYSVLLWSDFSGYSDLAIGSARLAGLRVPENFARPYAAPNLREFWQRWHVSFSRALTGYVFVPLSRALPRLLGDRPRAVGASTTLVTFLFCGWWHGPTLNFLLWGAWHAAGLVAYDLYKPWANKRRLKAGKKRAPRPTGWRGVLADAPAIAATFAFVTLGWILFVLPVRQLDNVRW